MFALRYGIHGTLDFRAPMVEAMMDFFQPTNEPLAQNKKKAARYAGDEPVAVPADARDDQKQPFDPAPDQPFQTIDIPDTTQGETKGDERARQQEVKAAGEEGDELSDGNEEGDRSTGERGKEGKDGSGEAGKQSGEAPKAGDMQKPQQGAGKESGSLMDKMRDAMANLMNKLKIPQQAGQQKQMASNQKGQAEGQREQSGGQKGEKGKGQPQGQGAPSDDPDADAGSEAEQQAQAGQGKSNDKGSDSGSPNDSKSGMGKQDGSKDLRDAEQAAAMGKLSEIYGKRAQNVTGEVMIEVSSSKAQQFRTGYTQKQATHREAGGEIHRDEIPLEFQHYVQQYFDHVRKGEAAPVDTTAAPAALAPPPARR
jgi:hypothetical protein